MVAFFPADNPRYTVLTTIETKARPGKAYYGGPLAGPVVKRLVDYIYNRGSGRSLQAAASGPRRYPQEVKGGDIAEIRHVAEHLSPHVTSDVRNGWGRPRVDSLATVRIRSFGGERTRVPDVRGMGLKDALFVLESRGLRVSFAGRGAVTSQSIAAGARIRRGAVVHIVLK